MTSSEITSQAPSQEMLYRTDKMTWMQAFAGFHGLRQGLIRYEDLPAGPGEDDPNGYAWRRDVQALLERTGTIDSYRRALLDGAYAADCPAWCQGKHPMLSPRNDTIGHEIVLSQVTFDGADTINRGQTVELSISAYQDENGTSLATLYVAGMPENLSPSDSEELAEAMGQASATLRLLVGDTPTIPDPTVQVMAEQDAVAEDVQ